MPPPPRSTRSAALFPRPTRFRSPFVALHRFRERDRDDGFRELGFPSDPRATRAAPHPRADDAHRRRGAGAPRAGGDPCHRLVPPTLRVARTAPAEGSAEHTSEIQSPMRNAYAVFCLINKTV